MTAIDDLEPCTESQAAELAAEDAAVERRTRILIKRRRRLQRERLGCAHLPDQVERVTAAIAVVDEKLAAMGVTVEHD
jgi:hypothetical protein